jgi:hypothetical protein
MQRYGARWVVLNALERDYWRPRWREPGGLPPELREVAVVENMLVFERVHRHDLGHHPGLQ